MKISAPNTTIVAPALPSQAPVAAATSLAPVYAKLVAVGLLWGGTFIAGRTLAHELPAMVVAAMRFAGGSCLSRAASACTVVVW